MACCEFTLTKKKKKKPVIRLLRDGSVEIQNWHVMWKWHAQHLWERDF